MLRINSINGVNNYIHSNKPSFKGNEGQTNPQIKELSNVNPDYAVKTPMAYTKTGELNFPYDTKAHCYKLANGQRVIIVPQDGETVLRTYVNTGSMNEPDKIRGISHYIEHNLFNGSQGMEEGDFFKQVDKMGASTNASTGFAETNYFISSNLLNKGDLENKIKIHASMLETPLFATEKLNKEKSIVNSEINMITSDPENLAINKTLKNLYNIKTTSTDMIGGTTDNINHLTRDDVVNYYNNNYYPANMVTVISGDVKPDEAIQLIAKHFTSKKQQNGQRHIETFKPIENTVREDIISDKAAATTVVVGFNGAPTDNIKDRIYLEAVSKLLSNTQTSRINKNLKQYNTDCDVQDEKISTNPKDGRAVIFVSECSDGNSEKVLKTIFNQIGNIPNNPPTDDEMQIIKKNMLNNFSQIFETSFDTNNAIGSTILEKNEEYLNQYEQIVKNMTAQDLVNTAKKYLDVNKASVTLIHPGNTSEDTIKTNYKNVSFTGKSSTKEVINLNNVKQYNMPNNNYRVVTLNSKTDNAKINFKILTDDVYRGKPSAPMVLNILLDEGSMLRNQSDFQTDMAKNGISTFIGAGNTSVNAGINCNSQDMDKALKSLKEVIENPRFTNEDFEYAKNKIKEGILTSEKTPEDKLDSELYKGLSSGYSKNEVLKDLDSLTLEDVKAAYSDIIKNGKGSITVSAPFDKNPQLNETLFSNVSSFRPVKEFKPHELQKIYNPVESTKVLTDTDNKNQANIIEAFKFKVNQNIKDKVTIALLNTILGGNPSSRLFMDLRENQKLAYHVKSDFESNDNIGIFSLKIGTTTDNKDTGEQSFDNIKKSIEGFNKHINKIKTEKVTEEELNNAKLNLKNTILNSNQTSSDKVISLMAGINSPYGIARENMIFNEIDKITAEDVYNAANTIFGGKPTYSIVATQDTLNANKKFLDSLKN